MLFFANGTLMDCSSAGVAFAPPAGGFPVCPGAPVAPVHSGPTLAAVVADCCASKEAAHRRPVYVKSLRGYLARFIRGRESVPVAVVTLADVEAYLSQFPHAGSRATQLNRLNTLFSYALRREIIAKNPCTRIERVSIERGAPSVLTVEQCETLLRHVAGNKPTQLAFLVLGLFAGLRPMEIARTGWPAVNLDAATVTVDAAASKVRRRRLVTLQPNAVAWLQLAKDRKALLPPSEQSARRFRRQWAKVLGFKGWPADILRHTAASNLLALTGDAGKTATSLGNSISILHRHYVGLIQPADAARFWAITP